VSIAERKAALAKRDAGNERTDSAAWDKERYATAPATSAPTQKALTSIRAVERAAKADRLVRAREDDERAAETDQVATLVVHFVRVDLLDVVVVRETPFNRFNHVERYGQQDDGDDQHDEEREASRLVLCGHERDSGARGRRGSKRSARKTEQARNGVQADSGAA
jgi:hypothetical protein